MNNDKRHRNKNSQSRKSKRHAQSDRRVEREIEPHMAGDYILNTVLRDYLRNNLPPDFTARILGRLDSRATGQPTPAPNSYPPPSYSDDSLDEALGAALADINFGDERQTESSARGIKPATAGQYIPPDVIKVEPRLWDYKSVRWSAVGGLLAASIAGCLIAFRSSSITPVSPAQIVEVVPRNPEELVSNQANQDEATSTIAESTNVASTIESTASSSSAEQLAPKTASPATPPLAPEFQSPVIAASELFAKPQALPIADLKTIIDSQIAMIWQKANLPKSKKIADDLWFTRVSLIAIGRVPTAAEQEVFRANKSESREVETINKLVDSREFSMHWGRLLAEHYLGSNLNRSSDVQAPASQQFVAWFQDGIQNEIPLQKLDATIALPDANNSDLIVRQLFTQIYDQELANAKERDKNSKLAFKYNAKDAPIVNMTSRLLHRSGFNAASCVQCHNPNSSSLEFIPKANAISSKQFWSMAAYIQEKATESGIRESTTNNELFYEEDNGRITVASAKLPVQIGDTQRVVEMRDWFTQNETARSGLVETVWKNTFYQPLVPSFGLINEEAAEERDDLKTLLAGQLQSTGSLKHLVKTILQTDPIRSPDAAVTTKWFLRAQPDVLNAYHQRSRLFAFVPASAREPQTVRVAPGTELMVWLEAAKKASGNSQLAQPDTKLKTSNAAIPNTAGNKSIPGNSTSQAQLGLRISELPASQLLYVLSVSNPYSNLREYANRVTSTKLHWQDQVHHAYWVSEGRMASSKDLEQANAIYNQNGQNAAKSLTEILVGLSGSF